MAEEEFEIKNLPDLLSEQLGPNKEIVDVFIKKLPQNGYGSIMLKLDLKIKNKNGSEESEYVVAKILPPSELTRKMFNVQVTYKNEIAFYNTVLPTLRKFQKENGVNDGLSMFAKFYGARINLDGSDTVTDDAVLVLENLVESGYTNSSRKDGFDLDASKMILSDLAKFQGTAIALKQKHPKVFEDKIKASLTPFDFHQEVMKGIWDMLRMVLKENPEVAPLAETATSFESKKVPSSREPYATVAHCDLWVNNMMQKMKDGKVKKNVMVDFQVCDYRSCASDVFFFIWTSVRKDVIESKLDELIEHYHEELVDTIKRLKCDVSAFSLEKFYDELKIEADYEFGHSLMFSFFVKSTPPEMDKGPPPPPEEMAKLLPEFVKEYLWFMTLECNKRGWVY